MSDRKYTPGPWKEDTECWLVGSDGHYVVRVGAATSADARLITATPDLLAVAQMAATLDGTIKARQALAVLARAAIAKATP